MIQEKFVNYFSIITVLLLFIIIFFLELTAALSPQKYCENFAPGGAAIPSSESINLELTIGLPDVTGSHYYAGSDRISETTSKEITMYTFMPTKEEEERRNNNNENIGMRRI